MQTPDSTASICPFCSVGCTLAYNSDAGRATGRPGAANPNGRLCSKGIRAFDPIDRDDRLTTPLVREEGALRPATWPEALSRATSGILGVRERHGADALAFLGAPHCTNEENFLFAKIARLLGTNNVDNRARICHAAAAAAMRDRLGCDAMTNTLEDLPDADAFLVIGANPAERQPVAFNTAIRPAVNAGATLIHVDPRGNDTTRLADYHLAPRPGSDPAVLSGLAAVIIEENLVDETFIEHRTMGFDAFRTALGEGDTDAFAAAAGVDPGELRTVARAFAEPARAAAVCGTGIESAGHDRTDAPDALLNLLMLTGNLGRRGTGMNLFRGLNNEQGAVDMGSRPFTLPGGVPVADEAGRARIKAEWDTDPPTIPGRSELDLVRGFGEDVHAAWVFGENPAVSTLDVAVESRLATLDTLVVQDVFHTETVAHADVVLPASAWAEKAGTVTNLDRQVQRMHATTEPPRDARRDLRILCDLGRRLTGTTFDYDGPRSVFAEITRVTPSYGGMTMDGLEAGGQRWPMPAGSDDPVGVLHQERFASGALQAPFVPIPVPSPTVGKTGLVLISGRSVGEFAGVFDTGGDTIQIHPTDAADREIGNGDEVVITRGDQSGTATADVTDDVRPGCVFCHSALADHLDVRDGNRIHMSGS